MHEIYMCLCVCRRMYKKRGKERGKRFMFIKGFYSGRLLRLCLVKGYGCSGFIV